MASILSEVLHEKQNASKEEIHEMISKVEAKIISMTTDVNDSLDSCFVMNDSDVDRITAWSYDVNAAKTEAEEMMRRFQTEKQLYETSTAEMQDTEELLQTSLRDIRRLHSLVAIVEDLETLRLNFDSAAASAKVKKSSEGLKKLHEELEGENIGEWFQHLEELIEDQVHIVYESISKEWNAKFKFRKNHLIIEHYGTSVEVMLESLINIGHWDAIWNRFMAQLWAEILSKACSVEYNITVVNPPRKQDLGRTRMNFSGSFNSSTLQDVNQDSPVVLQGADRQGNASVASSVAELKRDRCLIQVDLAKPALSSIEHILQNILNVLQTIYDIFPEVARADLMKRMGAILGNRLCSTLSTKCLKPLILMNSNGNIEIATKGLKALADFSQTLWRLGFALPEEALNCIESFIANFDSLFRVQLKEDICSKSRDLIRAEVSKTIRYEPPSSAEATQARSPLGLLKSPVILDQCMEISLPIKEMVDMLISHITQYPEDGAIPANVLHMYLAIVSIPKHDSDSSCLTPLQAAIIHNNCWYLAHHASVSFEYCEHNVSPLRSKGDQAFGFLMRCMRSKLNTMIQSAFNGLDESVETGQDVSKGFLRVAEELSILNELFKDVLPSCTWATALALVVDHTVNELVNKVLSWDDINAKTASELADAFVKFAIECSYLFKGNATSVKEIDYRVSKHVKKWSRFRMLSFVLTASMIEIGDKWVSGCGPLSLAFTADEVRRLVRALFQNTDRRAAFLATIK